jgi:hypothetical protein
MLDRAGDPEHSSAKMIINYFFDSEYAEIYYLYRYGTDKAAANGSHPDKL